MGEPDSKETVKRSKWEVDINDIRFPDVKSEISFADTSELKPLDEIVGQPRALEALDLGVGIRHQNYHIFAAGLTGTGKLELLQTALTDRLDGQAAPTDWVYVNNFQHADHPIAINLPAGDAVRFSRATRELVDKLMDALPRAFREEDFSREKERLRGEYRKRGEAIIKELDKFARERELTARQTPDGNILFIPLKENGEAMSPEEVEGIAPDRLQELEARTEELLQKAERAVESQRQMMTDLNSDVRGVAQKFAAHMIQPWFEELEKQFDSPKLHDWIQHFRHHVVDHLDRFQQADQAIEPHLRNRRNQKRFLEYDVNVLVDNSGQDRAPVVIENAPNYRNLFGSIERVVDRHGRLTANFTRIKAGSLLRANGGYLVFDLLDAIREPYVWKELKRTLKCGEIQIETYDPFAIFSTTSLKPEPIALNVKLVAVGPPLVYHLLCLYDDDFSRVFRVKADFDDEVRRGPDACELYGQFVRRLSDTEDTLPFSADAIAELVRLGARLSGHREKVSTEFTLLADIVREADFWTRKDGGDVVSAGMVRKASDQRIFRSDLVAEKIRELISEGTFLFNFKDRAIGQVNGLAVVNLGDYAFGRPTRISASVGVGNAGIVNIERESQLSGQTYDKGVLILEGYLRNHYAQEQPLALSASLAMEQSYGGIDGDSASAAELLTLLSGIADVPLRQDIAITGSVNQWGEVQAIGGVNEKIEGFFDACHEVGLTGSQGVCIPRSNLRHVVLRPDVVEAIEAGSFHIWAVSDIDQLIELLTGMTAGEVDQTGSFHAAVYSRTSEMLEALKERETQASRQLWVPGSPQLPEDPRPPMPQLETTGFAGH